MNYVKMTCIYTTTPITSNIKLPQFYPEIENRVFSPVVLGDDSVRETFSKNGVPTEEQAKAYITMLGSTAGLKGNLPAAAIFDFSPAAEADTELAVKK